MRSRVKTEGADNVLPQSGSRSRGHDAFILLGLAAVVFAAAIAYMGGLDFPFYRDEVDYWKQTLEFVVDWPPGIQLLRSYGEPMTPLSFIYWGAVERTFAGGIPGLRISCLVLSIATLLIIGGKAQTRGRRALLCSIGLLAYPYWVPLSIVIYTDVPAVFLTLLGLWFYARGRSVASALAFILAIATRQYMVTVPAALLAAELAPAILSSRQWHWNRVIPLGVAIVSLMGWVFFFDGLVPSPSLDAYPAHTAALFNITPVYGLYFLSCVGAYFVIPEFLLFRRWREPWPFELSRRNLIIAGVLLAAFAIFQPPSDITMGPLNRAFLKLLPIASWGVVGEIARILFFAWLAWLACARFPHGDVVFWLLLSRGLMMTVVWEGWEKYHMVLIASLWYLRSLSELNKPLEVWGLDLSASRSIRP